VWLSQLTCPILPLILFSTLHVTGPDRQTTPAVHGDGAAPASTPELPRVETDDLVRPWPGATGFLPRTRRSPKDPRKFLARQTADQTPRGVVSSEELCSSPAASFGAAAPSVINGPRTRPSEADRVASPKPHLMWASAWDRGGSRCRRSLSPCQGGQSRDSSHTAAQGGPLHPRTR